MKLVTDEDGKAVFEDGHPVYEHEDGTKAPFDAKSSLDKLNGKIDNLTDEKDRHFKESKKLKTEIKKYEGIDPEKYEEAMTKFKAIEDQKLVDEKGVDALKRSMQEIFDEERAGIKSTYEEKLKEKDAMVGERDNVIYDLAIKNRFATNKFFAGENPVTIYPPDDAAKIFGNNFEVKIEGRGLRIVAKDDLGNPIISKKDIGEPAEFDEAIGILVEKHAKKHAILRSGKGGGPVTQGNIDPDSGVDINTLKPQEKIKAGLKKYYGNRM